MTALIIKSKVHFKHMLRELDMTQKQLAEKLGVTATMVSTWNKDESYPTYAAAYFEARFDAREQVRVAVEQGKKLVEHEAWKYRQVMPLTTNEYWDGVKLATNDIIDLVIERVMDDNSGELFDHVDEMVEAARDIAQEIIHEYIDQDEWIIYNRFHRAILEWSSNDEYAIENGLVDASQFEDIAQFHQTLAFWAYNGDVTEKFEEAIYQACASVERDRDENSCVKVFERYDVDGDKETVIELKTVHFESDCSMEYIAEKIFAHARRDEIHDRVYFMDDDAIVTIKSVTGATMTTEAGDLATEVQEHIDAMDD